MDHPFARSGRPIAEINAEAARNLRLACLHQAQATSAGGTHAEIVARAEAFYRFVIGPTRKRPRSRRRAPARKRKA